MMISWNNLLFDDVCEERSLLNSMLCDVVGRGTSLPRWNKWISPGAGHATMQLECHYVVLHQALTPCCLLAPLSCPMQHRQGQAQPSQGRGGSWEALPAELRQSV